jgi:hypothetical protein
MHMPLGAVMVTVEPLMLQWLLAVMVGVAPELVVATTMNVEYSGALAGAPVKVTMGVTEVGLSRYVCPQEILSTFGPGYGE